MQLNSKVALITGGARGLGKGFAEALLQKGCRVCIVDLLRETGKETEEEFRRRYGPGSAHFVLCDVTNPSQLEECFQLVKDKFGHLDIVVNNAGILNEESWEKMIDINLKAVVHGSYLGFKHMNKKAGGRGGVIINVSSIAGLTVIPTSPVYVASKHGVVSFTRSVATTVDISHPNHGVSINSLCPSFTETEMMNQSTKNSTESNLVVQMGIMKPARVVEAFMQLLQDEGRSGAAFVVTPVKMKYRYEGSKL